MRRLDRLSDFSWGLGHQFGARPTSRRGVLRGSAVVAGGALALLGASGSGIFVPRRAAAQDDGFPENEFFGSEIDVLNYALTIEHLDSTLYREGLDDFAEQDFVDAGYDASVRAYIEQIADNEATQVEFLTDTISDLGGEPVGQAEYNFPYATVPEFLALSQTVEEVGVDAYTGAAQYLIGNDDLLTAALTIHGIEARHLAYFRLLNGVVPFPEAFEAPLTPPEVIEAAAPLFVSGAPTLPIDSGADGGDDTAGDSGDAEDEADSTEGDEQTDAGSDGSSDDDGDEGTPEAEG